MVLSNDNIYEVDVRVINGRIELLTLVRYFQPWSPVVSQNSLNIILIQNWSLFLLTITSGPRQGLSLSHPEPLSSRPTSPPPLEILKMFLFPS